MVVASPSLQAEELNSPPLQYFLKHQLQTGTVKWLLYFLLVHWATNEKKVSQFNLLLHGSKCSSVLLQALLFPSRNQSTCLKTFSLQRQHTDFQRRQSQSSYIIYTSNVQLSVKNACVQNRGFFYLKKSHARFQLHQHFKRTENNWWIIATFRLIRNLPASKCRGTCTIFRILICFFWTVCAINLTYEVCEKLSVVVTE